MVLTDEYPPKPDFLTSQLQFLIAETAHLQQILQEKTIPSMLFGGVAIDFLGQVLLKNASTRDHTDIDILVPRAVLPMLNEVLPPGDYQETWTDKWFSRGDLTKSNEFLNIRAYRKASTDIEFFGFELNQQGDYLIPQLLNGFITPQRPQLTLKLEPTRLEWDSQVVVIPSPLSLRALLYMSKTDDVRDKSQVERDEQILNQSVVPFRIKKRRDNL